jgi:hypothetical protein
MEAIIVLFWALIVVGTPIALLVSTHVTFLHREAVLSDLALKFILTLVVHAGSAVVSFPLVFILVFAGAHTEPPGGVLNAGQRVFLVCAVAAYAALSWLECSFIYGRLIRPWLLFRHSSGKIEPIFPS